MRIFIIKIWLQIYTNSVDFSLFKKQDFFYFCSRKKESEALAMKSPFFFRYLCIFNDFLE